MKEEAEIKRVGRNFGGDEHLWHRLWQVVYTDLQIH